jgi:hypothetical protein
MKQITLRVDDRLAEFIKQAALARSESVNAYAQAVLSAALDPDFAGDEAEQLRERLDRAGLLALSSPVAQTPPDGATLEQARRRAGRGRSLASLVVGDRA